MNLQRARPALWQCVVIATIVSALAGCTRSVRPLKSPDATVAVTGGPSQSMIYLARTSTGLIAIDLGWWGARQAIAGAFRELDGSPDEVTDVFLTHTHRDHIAAWPLLRRGRFHVGQAEAPLLVGESRHRGLIPRVAERLKPSGLPKPNELDVRPFTGDTSFVFGHDTVFAFTVPGHTAGSTAYLFRGVLFLGDAVTYGHLSGFGPARRVYSDDARVAAANLDSLLARIPAARVHHVCTAHAHCTAYSARFLRDIRTEQ